MVPQSKHAVIVANGTFPTHKYPLSILGNADFLIACDGAATTVIKHGYKPDIIIGDLDSISQSIEEQYHDKLVKIADQETNDLTKSVHWACNNGFKKIQILGATGKREDHTLGNIALLYSYARIIDVEMVTDRGVFIPIKEDTTFKCTKGQQISLFSNHPDLKINSKNLKYPLNNMKISELWMGTLNETLSNEFTINFKGGEVIVYMAY